MGATALLDEMLDPFAECFNDESAQRILNFGVTPVVQQRVAELAEKANEGLLSEGEQSEYDALISAADFIAILKLKARRRLGHSNPIK